MNLSETKQLDFEIQFYERLLLDKKEQPEVLKLLAEAYTHRGFYKKGLEMDRLVCQLHPHDPNAHYNLACSLSLTQQLDEAFLTLEKAIQLGYRDASHLKKDKDLALLRRDPRYTQLLEKLAPH